MLRLSVIMRNQIWKYGSEFCPHNEAEKHATLQAWTFIFINCIVHPHFSLPLLENCSNINVLPFADTVILSVRAGQFHLFIKILPQKQN